MTCSKNNKLYIIFIQSYFDLKFVDSTQYSGKDVVFIVTGPLVLFKGVLEIFDKNNGKRAIHIPFIDFKKPINLLKTRFILNDFLKAYSHKIGREITIIYHTAHYDYVTYNIIKKLKKNQSVTVTYHDVYGRKFGEVASLNFIVRFKVLLYRIFFCDLGSYGFGSDIKNGLMPPFESLTDCIKARSESVVNPVKILNVHPEIKKGDVILVDSDEQSYFKKFDFNTLKSFFRSLDSKVHVKSHPAYRSSPYLKEFSKIETYLPIGFLDFPKGIIVIGFFSTALYEISQREDVLVISLIKLIPPSPLSLDALNYIQRLDFQGKILYPDSLKELFELLVMKN
jgi:hypothetical protein